MADITGYAGRSLRFKGTVIGLSALTGYTAVAKLSFRNELVSGVISGLEITFTVAAADMKSVSAGNYDYEVIIHKTGTEYTIDKGTVEIKPSLVLNPAE
jgi:hypothetical protein